MTGGSARSLGSGLSDESNARDSSAKECLLTSSNRRKARPVSLSVFSSSGARSEENIPLMPHGETTFTDHDSSNSEFIATDMAHAGRLRTSSLTSDVSSQNSKGVDSGNSSLIGSSSTDSYPDFESGSSSGRSRRTGSSKSEQNLTRKCQNEFTARPKKGRHTSMTDSTSGSSEKVSLNTSDVTETSDESLPSTENGRSSPDPAAFYSEHAHYNVSEAQPFIYFSTPKSSSFIGMDIGDNCGLVRDFQEGSSVPDDSDEHSFGCAAHDDVDIFNSTVINIDPNATSETASSAKKSHNRNAKNAYRRATDYNNENEPLLRDSAADRILGCAESSITSSNSTSNAHLRRVASLGNIPKINLDNNEPHGKPPLTSSKMSGSAVNSQIQAAPTVRGNNKHNSTHISNAQYLSSFQNHPCYAQCGSYPAAVYPVKLGPLSPMAPQYPTPMLVGLPHTMPSSSVFTNHSERGTSNVSNNLTSNSLVLHPFTYPEDHMCSNLSDPYRSSFTTASQCDSTKSSNVAAKVVHPNVSHPFYLEETSNSNVPSGGAGSDSFNTETSTVVTSVAKIPSQDLESVLGYGTPFSQSALKNGSKSISSENAKPLQVLVPKAKETAEEIKQIYLAKKSDPLFPTSFDEQQTHPQIDHTKFMQSSSASSNQDSQTGTPLITSPYQRNSFQLPNQTFSPEERHMYCHTLSNSATSMPYPALGHLDYSQRPLFLGEDIKGPYPTFSNVHAIGAGQATGVLHGTSNRVYIAPNPEYAVLTPFYSGPFMTPDPNSVKVSAHSSQCHENEPLRYPRHSRGCDSEPIYSYPAKKLPGNHSAGIHGQVPSSSSNTTNSNNHGHMRPLTIAVSQDLVNHRHALSPKTHSTLYPLTVEFAPNDSNISKYEHHPLNHGVQLGHLKRTQQQLAREDIPAGEAADLNSGAVDDNGYQAGMVLRVPRSCFEPDFLDTAHDENLGRSRRESMRQSTPSSIDSGHAENNQGSLARLDTSQLGLLKGSPNESGTCGGFINREVPDYRFLCFTAIIFNPLLGIIAFFCNRSARRNFRLQNHTRANYLYIATILISTVAIFLTLVGLALLIARIVVLKSEDDKEDSTLPSELSCHNKLFGHDDSLKNFYDMDLKYYCEVIKNERVMNALIHYWVLDAQNKKKHSKQGAQNQNNSTLTSLDSGELDDISEADLKRIQELEGEAVDNKPDDDAPDNVKKEDPKSSDADKSRKPLGIPKIPKNISEARGSHNTVIDSDDGPYIPPGLEEQHQLFLEGEKRTKASPEETRSLLGVGAGPLDDISLGASSADRMNPPSSTSITNKVDMTTPSPAMADIPKERENQTEPNVLHNLQNETFTDAEESSTWMKGSLDNSTQVPVNTPSS